MLQNFKSVRGQARKDALEGVVTGNPMWQFQAQTLPQPTLFGHAVIFHVNKALGPAHDGAQSNAQNVH